MVAAENPMMLNAHALSLGSQKSAHECVAIRRRRPPRASSPHRPERGNSGACGPRLPGKEDHVAQLCQVRVFPFRLQLFVPVHGRFSVRALKVIAADYAFFRAELPALITTVEGLAVVVDGARCLYADPRVQAGVRQSFAARHGHLRHVCRARRDRARHGRARRAVDVMKNIW